MLTGAPDGRHAGGCVSIAVRFGAELQVSHARQSRLSAMAVDPRSTGLPGVAGGRSRDIISDMTNAFRTDLPPFPRPSPRASPSPAPFASPLRSRPAPRPVAAGTTLKHPLRARCRIPCLHITSPGPSPSRRPVSSIGAPQRFTSLLTRRAAASSPRATLSSSRSQARSRPVCDRTPRYGAAPSSSGPWPCARSPPRTWLRTLRW